MRQYYFVAPNMRQCYLVVTDLWPHIYIFAENFSARFFFTMEEVITIRSKRRDVEGQGKTFTDISIQILIFYVHML